MLNGLRDGLNPYKTVPSSYYTPTYFLPISLLTQQLTSLQHEPWNLLHCVACDIPGEDPIALVLNVSTSW